VAIAIVAEVSTISIALHGVGMLLPIARFAGYAWLITAAALLPRKRHPPPRRRLHALRDRRAVWCHW